MSTLVEISREQIDLSDSIILLAEAGQDVPIELLTRLTQIVSDSEDKITNWINFLGREDFEIEYLEKKIKEAQIELASMKSKQQRRMDLCKQAMYILNSKRIDGKFGKKMWLQTNSRVEVDVEASQLPIDLVRAKTTYEPNKIEIKDRLEKGEAIDGCRLVFTEHLRFK